MNNKIALTMESLDLPREYWELKLEPASPTSAMVSELFALDDPTANFLYDDNFATGLLYISDEQADSLQEDISMDLLSDEDLVVEFLDLKDEECLLDQKSPHYIDYESGGFSQALDVAPQDIILPVPKVQDAAAARNTDSDFQHGDSSLILQQLTPPQSPPQFDGYQQQQQQLEQQHVKEEQKVLSFAMDAAVPLAPTASTVAYNFNNWVPVSEIARETQLVDDIVNMRAQELQLPVNWQQYNEDSESQASSSLSSSSSRSSSSRSSSSRSSSNGDISGAFSSIADEEWLPASSSSTSGSPRHTINADEEQHLTSTGAKKRTRTYGRGVEDRKIRKKEQNKNAATRYRQKKKLEMEHVLGEELELTQANEELRRKLNESRRESRYLRQLIREFYKERKQ